MKKLLLISSLIPVICTAQSSKSDSISAKSAPKIKFQYIETRTTRQQTDTIANVLRNAMDVIPFAGAALNIYSNSSELRNVYEAVDTTKKEKK